MSGKRLEAEPLHRVTAGPASHQPPVILPAGSGGDELTAMLVHQYDLPHAHIRVIPGIRSPPGDTNIKRILIGMNDRIIIPGTAAGVRDAFEKAAHQGWRQVFLQSFAPAAVIKWFLMLSKIYFFHYQPRAIGQTDVPALTCPQEHQDRARNDERS